MTGSHLSSLPPARIAFGNLTIVPNDARLMTMLADFAAMGYRQQKQQVRLIAQERAAAAAQMANRLAHEINNPLQSMTNAAYLVAEGAAEQDPRVLGREHSNDISRLSGLVKELFNNRIIVEE
jgi:nitrogen-specific signal transduction histidine kinase